MSDYWEKKYLKYKNKYNTLKMFGGRKNIVEELKVKDIDLINKLYKFITNKDTPYTPANPVIGKTNIIQDGEKVTKHSLAAAMLHKDGDIVYGVSSNSPLGYNIHGEGAVISAAHLKDPDPNNWVSIVCLVPPKFSSQNREDKQIIVKSSCGSCRELLRYQYPNIYLITPDPTISFEVTKTNANDDNKSYKVSGQIDFNTYIKSLGLKKVQAKYLLPFPYVNGDLLEESKWNPNIDIKFGAVERN